MDDYLEEMIRLISDYASKRKVIDQNFFERLACIVSGKKELYYYIRHVKVKNRIGGPVAGYDPITSVLKLNLNAMKKEFSSLNLQAYSIPEDELLFEYYFHACRIFLHECCHAEQYKSFCRNKEDIQSKILAPIYDPIAYLEAQEHIQESFLESYKNVREIHKMIKKKDSYYSINPAERLADIESYKEILEMAKCLCLKKAYLYNEYALYSVYLKAYVKEYVPTLAFLRYMGYSDSIEEIKSLTGEMQQKDRLLLGLNISEKKFKKLVRKQEDAWHHFNE